MPVPALSQGLPICWDVAIHYSIRYGEAQGSSSYSGLLRPYTEYHLPMPDANGPFVLTLDEGEETKVHPV